MLLSWSWLFTTIAIVGHVSFMVIVVWCHHCYCFLLCGCGQLPPSLLLTFPLWSWLHSTLITFVISFMAMVTWHHQCCCLFHGHGRLVSSLLLLLLPWSWLPNAIVATIVTFVVTITWCHCYCYCFFHNPGCLASSCYCCSCFLCGCVHLQNTFAYCCSCFHHGRGHPSVIITITTLFHEQNVFPPFLALCRCGMVDVERTLV